MTVSQNRLPLINPCLGGKGPQLKLWSLLSGCRLPRLGLSHPPVRAQPPELIKHVLFCVWWPLSHRQLPLIDRAHLSITGPAQRPLRVNAGPSAPAGVNACLPDMGILPLRAKTSPSLPLCPRVSCRPLTMPGRLH